MPQVIKDITIPQLLGWLLMASLSINTYLLKEELTSLRSDLKELKVAQAVLTTGQATLQARFESHEEYARRTR